MTKLVPNLFPTQPDSQGRRLAVVGEAPGVDEEQVGIPFVGPSGKLLHIVLANSGILPQSCFLGNICQQRPPNNEIDSFDCLPVTIRANSASHRAESDISLVVHDTFNTRQAPMTAP